MKTALLFVIAAVSGATAALAQERPPLRPLGAIEATSAESFGPAINLRHTGNGVLVNDPRNRRVLLLDDQLKLVKVVADSTPATATAYSGRTGGLIAFTGDSTLFVDPGSMSMLLIDPNGDVSRVMSVPRSQDAMMLGTPIAGTPGLDGRGGLVYRGFPRFEMRRAAPAGGSPQAFVPPQMPDSTPVVRVDLTSRAVDTLGWVKIPQVRMEMTQDSLGRMNFTPIMNPLPVIDDWAVLSDGSVAMLRGRDYHIDWIRPDGTRESTGKIPFDWRRLSDDDKVAFMDSVKAQRERMLAEAPRDTGVTERLTMREGPGRVQGRPGASADGRRTMVEGGARIMIGGGGGDPAQMMMGNRQLTFVDPQELPDYQPVFFANSVRADADGNLWVRTIPTKAVGPGATYDVINGRGELVDRVQVPANRTIIGFGAGGIVYLATTTDGKTTLERARVR